MVWIETAGLYKICGPLRMLEHYIKYESYIHIDSADVQGKDVLSWYLLNIRGAWFIGSPTMSSAKNKVYKP